MYLFISLFIFALVPTEFLSDAKVQIFVRNILHQEVLGDFRVDLS